MKLNNILEVLTIGKRLEFETYIHKEIELIKKSIEILLNNKTFHDLESALNDMENIDKNFSELICDLNKDCESNLRKPFYWTNIYSLCHEFQVLFSILNMFYHQEKIYKMIPSYQSLFHSQLLILKNINNFIDEFIRNRKYISELLKNNENEIKNFSRIHLSSMEKSHMSENSSREKFELLRTLAILNNKNKEIQIILNEIFISSHM